MEDLIETLARGNVTEVKVLLASVALALGVYQVCVIAVGYGAVRLRALDAPPALRAHRAVGDTAALLMLGVGAMCVGVHGFEGGAHSIAATALLAVLALKVAVVRRDLGLGRFLPVLGGTVLLLLAVTWATSAGAFLA